VRPAGLARGIAARCFLKDAVAKRLGRHGLLIFMLNFNDRRMKHALRIGISLLLFTAACGQKSADKHEPEYGDPVGISLVASKDVPAVEVAIAVSKGVVIDPLVEPLSSLLHRGLKACSGVVAASLKAEPAHLSFVVEQGKTKNTSVTGASADCLIKSLDAQDFAGKAPGKLHVMAIVRLAPALPAASQEGLKP
jgi:hypothetical protein